MVNHQLAEGDAITEERQQLKSGGHPRGMEHRRQAFFLVSVQGDVIHLRAQTQDMEMKCSNFHARAGQLFELQDQKHPGPAIHQTGLHHH